MSSPGRPVVILGVPRSGTTLLRRLLNRHPDLFCPGETFLLASAARFLEHDVVASGLIYGVDGGLAELGIGSDVISGDLFSLVDGYMSTAAHAAGKTRWVMKTAIDAFYVANVERICADRVSFVVILRHVLDVVASLKDLCDANEMYIRELHRYVVRYPRPELAFAHAWRDVTESLLALAERRPDDVLLCRYEDLVENTDLVLDEILRFIGAASVSDLTRALSEDTPSGIGDWKTYATTKIERDRAHRWRDRDVRTHAALAAVANETLVRAGYERLQPHDDDSAAARRRYELLARLNAARARATRDPED